MHHYFEAITNTSGASLIGYFARVIDRTTQGTVPIYADDNGTPIITVSGHADMAKTDEYGNLDFYIEPGSYHLDIYAPDATTFRFRVPNVGMNSTKGDTGPAGPPGPAGNVAADLPTLKAADTSNVTMIYDQATFTWTPGDYTGQADDINIIQSDNVPLNQGAWVRQSAAAITFRQDGEGAIPRTLQDKAREVVSVTDFGASPSATAAQNVQAIQAALNTGKHVRLPGAPLSIDGPVITTVAGQMIVGDGAASVLTVTGTNDNANGIIVAHDDCTVENVTVVPSTTISNLGQGWGVTVSGHRAIIRGVRVKNMRRGGIRLINANNCIIEGNIFTDSVVTQDPADPEPQSAMGYDIYLQGTSSYNIVRGNQCVSGCGVGVGLQNVEIGKSMYGNIITGNVVRFQPCYGIMLYLSASGMGEPTDSVANNVISNNVVTDISGSVLIPADPTTLYYGAGIYIQGSDNVICSNNQVLRTCTDQSKPRSGTGVPAAIAVTGYSRSVVQGNLIDECHWGIAVITASYALPDGDGAILSSNQVRGARSHGFYLASANSVTASDNRIVSAAGNISNGIFVVQGANLPMGPIQINGNLISGFNVGIECNTVTAATVGSILVQANKIRNFTTYGVYVKADEADIQNNNIASATGSGIVLASAVGRGLVEGNVIITPGGNALEDASASVTVGENDFASGALVGYPAALANSATPSLKGRRFVRNSNTTTITGFTDGQEGQRVIMTAEATFILANTSGLRTPTNADVTVTSGQVVELVYSNARWRLI